MAIGPLYRPLLEVARERGHEVEPVLGQLGLNAAQLVEPSTRLSPDQGRALLRGLVALTGDPELGLRAAERFTLADVDLVGYLARHCAHALAALESLTRFGRVLGDSADFRLERSGGEVTISFGLTGGHQLEPESSDFAAACCARLMRELSHDRALLLEVRLPRPAPSRPSRYRRHFGAPVSYQAACAALVYSEASLLAPLPGRDPRLLRILEERAGEITAGLPEAGSWLERVRNEIARLLAAGSCELGEVALRCGVSERTLRRRLEAAHTSYRKLVDDVRRERALALIHAGQQRVAPIAHLLGFSDATAFARAFRRWTGATPQAYLLRLRVSKADAS